MAYVLCDSRLELARFCLSALALDFISDAPLVDRSAILAILKQDFNQRSELRLHSAWRAKPLAVVQKRASWDSVPLGWVSEANG